MDEVEESSSGAGYEEEDILLSDLGLRGFGNSNEIASDEAMSSPEESDIVSTNYNSSQESDPQSSLVIPKERSTNKILRDIGVGAAALLGIWGVVEVPKYLNGQGTSASGKHTVITEPAITTSIVGGPVRLKNYVYLYPTFFLGKGTEAGSLTTVSAGQELCIRSVREVTIDMHSYAVAEVPLAVGGALRNYYVLASSNDMENIGSKEGSSACDPVRSDRPGIRVVHPPVLKR